MRLQVWTLYFPDKKLEAAVTWAICWELGRIGADGKVHVAGNTRTGLEQEHWLGHPNGVDLSEITLCLLYHYTRTGDEDTLAAGRRDPQAVVRPRDVFTEWQSRPLRSLFVTPI
ncbi:MAG: hypothetical protein WCB27_13820 [Thermoguttaceae bacterium]